MRPMPWVATACSIVLIAASVPVAAQNAAAPKPELTTQKITDHLYVILGGGGNVAVGTGADGTFLIDDKLGTLTSELAATVRAISSAPVRFVINTHWHFDHTGNNAAYSGQGAVILAHENVRRRMSVPQLIEAFNRQVPASPPAALPVVTFDQGVTLHLNGDTISVFHVANAHTDGDAIIQFREQNIVHMGDVYTSGRYPFIDISSGGSIDGVIAAVNSVLKAIDGKTVVIPGHGPVSDRAGLEKFRDQMVEARTRVDDLIAKGRTRAEVLAARPFAEFEDRYDQRAMTTDQFIGIVYDDRARTMKH